MQLAHESAASAPGRRSRTSIVLSVLELPLALALAFSLMLIFTKAVCSLWRFQCDDLASLNWLMRGAVVGIVLGVLYWCVAFALGDRRKPRIVLDTIVLLIAIAPFAIR